MVGEKGLARAREPGSREWAMLSAGIDVGGWAILPLIIFAS